MPTHPAVSGKAGSKIEAGDAATENAQRAQIDRPAEWLHRCCAKKLGKNAEKVHISVGGQGPGP